MNGIRILDLTRVLAGPQATQMLADQGAEVVKIEAPGGDETRGFGPFVDGYSTYFMASNRNKRSVVLDLRTDAGREVLDRLLARADVLIENFRPGVAERLGFGWTDVHRRFPRLVYVGISAFGEDAPPAWRRRPGYDIVFQAMGGSAAVNGLPGHPPLRHGLPIADLFGAMLAAQAVLVGLLERERTGRTQKIAVNMMQVQAAMLVYHATRFTMTGEVEERLGNAHRGLVPYDVYRCADGWLALACGNDGIWQRLVAALGLPDRPEWARNPDRLQHRAAVDAAVGTALAGLQVAAADALLADAGVPAGPVLPLDRTLAHPAVTQVQALHPVLGPLTLPGPAITTATTRPAHDPPPLLGEHRDAVLGELGYDARAIAALADRGAFGPTGSRPHDPAG
jgi:crotonobetainyl-CoA:carnitine CoA-transferase CaiB-like acyl-CoA transferase